ncbi:MAG: hypothetical protein U1E29_11205 [Coriobacteriia bacterium]|nr:hypothetical protein [Coriobacteriia bacterium]
MAEPDDGVTKPADPAPPTERTIIEAAADLLQTVVDWLRQEAEGVVRKKVVLPLQRLGFTLASMYIAATLMIFGLIVISVASMILLAEALTWPGALYLVGGLLVLGAVIFAFIQGRLMQK